MRRIGTLNDGTLAQRFCDYLVTLKIDATSEADDQGDQAAWHIWIRNETDVDKAREQLAAFEAAPNEPRYQVEREVARIRNERIAEEQQRLKRNRKLVQSMPTSRGSSLGPLTGAAVRQQSIPITIGIIVLSVIASFATNFGRPRARGNELTLEQRLYFGLSIADPREYQFSSDPYEAIKRGEVWRFITPMFMHGDAMHLAFNMLWMYFLGSAIERLQGSLFFLALVLGTAFVGLNVHVLMSGMEFLPPTLQGTPFAIGASGAVYGLFGYLWVRPAIDPDYPIRLVPMNVVLMLGWLVLCMTPLIPNVANGAHLGGLFAGILAATMGSRVAHA